MVKDENLNINVVTNEKGVVTILHGKAKDPEPNPKGLQLAGILTSPFNYYIGRKAVVDELKEKCHLLIDVDGLEMSLRINDKSAIDPDLITGKLRIDDKLAEWGINTTRIWQVREFVKFIRPKKYQFANGDQQIAMIAELLNWHVKIEKEIKDFSDNRGNSLSSLETRVGQVKFTDSFQLNIPVFSGYGKRTFTVLIGLEVTSNGVAFNLFSDDLAEAMPQLAEQYIGDELKKFEDAGFDCSRIFV